MFDGMIQNSTSTISPVVLRFAMASPVILADGASLDAMAAYLLFAQGEDGIEGLDALFARTGRVHNASWLFPESGFVAGSTGFVRLQRVGAALNERNIIAPRGSSRFRVDHKRNDAVNILTRYATISTPAVWAFALGDAAALAGLFADVTAIGLKRGDGFGRVERIEIGSIEGWADFGRSMPDQTPARAIPEDEWGRKAKRGAYALGFPRWSSAAERCAIPDARTIDPRIFGTLSEVEESSAA